MNNYTILCVDDEKTITCSLKGQLMKILGDKISIETADDGYEALEILKELMEQKKQIPIVISDYYMPGIKGDELLKRIHEINPSIYKILLSGQIPLNGVMNAMKNANLYRYIGKPWGKDNIEFVVKEAIRCYTKDLKNM